MGSRLLADNIVLLAGSGVELQTLLDEVAIFASRWHLMFTPKKCGVLVVGKKKRIKSGAWVR